MLSCCQCVLWLTVHHTAKVPEEVQGTRWYNFQSSTPTQSAKVHAQLYRWTERQTDIRHYLVTGPGIVLNLKVTVLSCLDVIILYISIIHITSNSTIFGDNDYGDHSDERNCSKWYFKFLSDDSPPSNRQCITYFLSSWFCIFGSSMKWFKSSFRCCFLVKYDFSSLYGSICGTPKGSVLGPPLFRCFKFLCALLLYKWPNLGIV